MEFFDKKDHTINECGGYEFNFHIDNVEDDGSQFIVSVTVDDINGEVILIMDGTLHKIKEMRDDPDFGWEVEGEIEDCIYEYIVKNIEDKTGISFTMEYVKFKSDL
jgi:D-Tyr-tRNAtyr deacylase